MTTLGPLVLLSRAIIMNAPSKTWFLPLSALAAVLMLVACGSGEPAARVQSTRLDGAGVAAPGAEADADLSAAVGASSSATLFALKFKLEAAPVVGRAATVSLVVIPVGNAGFDRVFMNLRPGDGLRLLSDTSTDTTGTTPGEPIRYDIRVEPATAGVLTLGVTLVVDAESQSLTRTYTIPLIAVPAAG